MRRRFLSSLLLLTLCLATPASAVAFDPFRGACTNGVPKAEHSAACKADGSDPISGTQGILIDATHIIAYLGGALAVIMIIVGAIRFITSGSDMSTGSRTDTDIEEARRTIVSALIGLAVIILAQAIITYVIRKF